MRLFFSRSGQKQQSFSLVLLVSLLLPQVMVCAQPNLPTKSGFSEETLAGFVNQLSDGLATKIQTSTCPEAVSLLDKIKEASAKPIDEVSLVGKVLMDVKANPKLREIVVQKVGSPLID